MNKPDIINTLLVDGDIIAYRAAFSVGDLGYPWEVEAKVDDLMDYVIGETLVFSSGSDYTTYLTGKNNFRHDIAVTAEYKGNRKSSSKPAMLPDARRYLVESYRGKIINGQEADDAIAIEATRNDPDTTVVASVDKDMLQIPCWHFNFVTGAWTFVDEASGRKSFYKQILTGDAADNIKGIFKVGPVKADKILEGITEEKDLYEAVVKAYDGDKERVLENARLLWLRREEGQMWQPPE
jgi:5'-3' exonuclease